MRFWGYGRASSVAVAVLLIYVGWRAIREEHLALFLLGERRGDDAKRWGWILLVSGGLLLVSRFLNYPRG